MDDLIAFLRARLDEDEAVAREATAAGASGGAEHWRAERVKYRHAETGVHDTWIVKGDRVKTPTLAVGPIDITPRVTSHIARWDPARVLAEVEAKRRILDGYTGDPVNPPWQAWDDDAGVAIEWVLRVLAQSYAEHPDYRSEWRP